MSHTERVRTAVETTNLHAPPALFRGTCRARAGLTSEPSGPVGSFYEGLTPEALERVIPALHWESYEHPAVAAGCAAFRAELPGFVGVVPLRSLDLSQVVTLLDPKSSGFVEAVADFDGDLPSSPFTVIILGQYEGREIVYTFHPGEPIRPSSVAADRDGQRVTVDQAVRLGLEYAKVTGRAPPTR